MLRIEIENSLQLDSPVSDLIASLKENMRVKFDERFPITHEMLVATMLDPRFQNSPKLLSEIHKSVVSDSQKASTSKPSKTIGSKQSAMAKLTEKYAYCTASESSSQESKRIDEEIHQHVLTDFFFEVVE